MGADTDTGKIFTVVDRASGAGSLVKNVVNGPFAYCGVETRREEFANAPYGRTADQDQGGDHPPQPFLRDRDREEHAGFVVF